MQGGYVQNTQFSLEFTEKYEKHGYRFLFHKNNENQYSCVLPNRTLTNTTLIGKETVNARYLQFKSKEERAEYEEFTMVFIPSDIQLGGIRDAEQSEITTVVDDIKVALGAYSGLQKIPNDCMEYIKNKLRSIPNIETIQLLARSVPISEESSLKVRSFDEVRTLLTTPSPDDSFIADFL